jgi:hypothetical protein
MALVSAGVQVTVIDESFYTPAEPGTVPMIFIATAQDKTNSAGTGTAQGTLAANAGKPYLVTSQRDLSETFGDAIFYTDTNNNPIHGGELNEYGLQAAYSFLGVSNRAYVVRADINLAQLQATATEPSSSPAAGTYWFDTQASTFGIFEWNKSSQSFTNKVPMVITETTQVVNFAGEDYTPKQSVGVVGDYAISAVYFTNTLYYKNSSNTWVEVGSAAWIASHTTPELVVQPHTQVPQWKTVGGSDENTGSVWVKTTSPNAGAKFKIKKYNATTKLWEEISAPLYLSQQEAIYGLDKTQGGYNIPVGILYVHAYKDPNNKVHFIIKRKETSGATIVKSSPVSAPAVNALYTFTITETQVGDDTLHAVTPGAIEISVANTDNDQTVAEKVAAAINGESWENISASVDNLKRVVITHAQGGDFVILPANPTSKTFLNNSLGLDEDSTNFYLENYADATSGYRASNFKPLDYVAGENQPTSLATDGQLWYNSIVDDVDIMIHDGSTWVGYANGTVGTDSNGPQVRATEPTTQSNGDPLVTGDLWIDSGDTENYPKLYKYNLDSTTWVLVDKTDQTTEDGILFADARYNTSGANSDEAGSIASLLASDYLDPDAPDPDLYPQGMLLFNTRRSGFNVKKFVRNYIDLNALNTNNGDESMANYYPHRWKTESGNKENGSGNFGRLAQRKVVVQALQALLNSNEEIRDDASRIFNLIACPGYSELISEMISLNYDRGLSAFVIGDSPFRLTPDATSLNEWATNVNQAVQDNDEGLVSYDEYMGVFYPSGFTSDNFGNDVVVPASHMILRTFALSDQVSYPWFAPAGTRRGTITNASAAGYISSEGEFVSVALNEGQRDTLYTSNVNPITFITGAGLVNFGQKTRARNASALDRINVARLVIYLRSQLNKLAKPYVFEPNDKITRDEIKQQVESLLLELVGQRALYDFIVVCDETNNTPARIDRNELYLDIAIEPVKAVEFIYIPLRLKNTGEIAGL